MIRADEWFAEALRRGYDFVTGVPCSFLTPFINYAISNEATRYVGAASEGEALGIAAGAWLGGRKAIALCQNSGLGNMVNPLTSLAWPFRIPALLVVTWRGQPGVKDEPQHQLMGAVTPRLFDLMEIPHAPFPTEAAEIAPTLDAAEAAIAETSRPYAFLMRKGSVAPYELRPRPVDRGAFPADPLDERLLEPALSRLAATAVVRETLGGAWAYLATTGKLGRELFTLRDAPNHFYHVGAMGCVSGVGLGVALAHPERRVAVLDGDGSVLMKMGTLATIGHYAPRNLLHVVLDNEQHESTGGQATVSRTVSFARVAVAAGYRRAYACGREADLRDVIRRAADGEGPALVHVKVGVRTESGLGRPTVAPEGVARRFRAWFAGEGS